MAALSLRGDKDGPALPTTTSPPAALGLEDMAVAPLDFFADECTAEEDAARRLDAYRRIRYEKGHQGFGSRPLGVGSGVHVSVLGSEGEGRGERAERWRPTAAHPPTQQAGGGGDRAGGDGGGPPALLARSVVWVWVRMLVGERARCRMKRSFLPSTPSPSTTLPRRTTTTDKAAVVRDDEALLIMAQELGDCASLVPHKPTALLPCLALLAGTEETVVRDAAVHSIVKCVSALVSSFTHGPSLPPSSAVVGSCAPPPTTHLSFFSSSARLSSCMHPRTLHQLNTPHPPTHSPIPPHPTRPCHRVLNGLPGPVPEAVEAVKGLANGELFSHKLSAAALLPAVYPRAGGEEQR